MASCLIREEGEKEGWWREGGMVERRRDGGGKEGRKRAEVSDEDGC